MNRRGLIIGEHPEMLAGNGRRPKAWLMAELDFTEGRILRVGIFSEPDPNVRAETAWAQLGLGYGDNYHDARQALYEAARSHPRLGEFYRRVLHP